jgi:hypothetical protein
MDDADHEEGCHVADKAGQPKGYGKGEKEYHHHRDEEEKHKKRGGLQQTYELVDYVELQVFALKPEVMLDNPNNLGNGFYILVAT